MTPGPAASRPDPPMFATATGRGDNCGSCLTATGKLVPKLLLPGGIQACRRCDS